MNKIIILLIAITATFAGFAQKSKGNSDISKTGTVLTKYICPMHPGVTSDKPGKCSKCGMDLTLSKKEQMKRDVMKIYSCSMHSEVVSNSPGKCPRCSAKLVVDRRGSKQAATVYTCSMHPGVSSATEGKCPVCGLDMVGKETKKD